MESCQIMAFLLILMPILMSDNAEMGGGKTNHKLKGSIV